MTHHVISRLRGTRPLMVDVVTARRLSSVILGFASKYDVILFSIPGDHIHTVACCGRKKAGRLARALEAAITVVLGFDPGFRPAQIWPVSGDEHFKNLVPYCLGQHEKHSVFSDPLLESSNILDLLSIRLLDPSSGVALRSAAPWLKSGDITDWLGGPLHLGTDVTRLPEAIQVVTGGLPHLSKRRPAVRAREASIRLARGAGLGFRATADLIEVSGALVSRALQRRDLAADRAVRLAVGLLERRCLARNLVA